MAKKNIDPSLLDDFAELDALLGSTLNKVDEKIKDYSAFTKEKKSVTNTEENADEVDEVEKPSDWASKKDDALASAESKADLLAQKLKAAKNKNQDWEDDKI